MLQYVLCASRFSHYLKVIMRDHIGQLSTASAIQRKLEDWLSGYTLGNDDAEVSLRTRYPLRSAGITVFEIPGKPGSFSAPCGFSRISSWMTFPPASTSSPRPRLLPSHDHPAEQRRISA